VGPPSFSAEPPPSVDVSEPPQPTHAKVTEAERGIAQVHRRRLFIEKIL